MSDVSEILSAIEQGNPLAAERLLPLVYDELRRLAAARLAGDSAGHSLQATALVHEAYLRLVGPNGDRPTPSGNDEAMSQVAERWGDRRYFFAAAAQAMRRVLIDRARHKARQKRGGEWQRVELADWAEPLVDEQLLALDEALLRLAEEDPTAAQVVELHHFAGLSHDEVAATLEITSYQARQKWTYARAWLHDALAKEK